KQKVASTQHRAVLSIHFINLGHTASLMTRKIAEISAALSIMDIEVPGPHHEIIASLLQEAPRPPQLVQMAPFSQMAGIILHLVTLLIILFTSSALLLKGGIRLSSPMDEVLTT